MFSSVSDIIYSQNANVLCLCEKSIDISQICSNDVEINQHFRRLLASVQWLDSPVVRFQLEVIAFAKTKCVATVKCQGRETLAV